MRKLKNRSGETLVETLISVLIVTLASVVLVQTVISSVGIGSKSRGADREFSSALASAEGESAQTGQGTVTISGNGKSYSAAVNYYGGGSGSRALTSYSPGSALS